MNKDTLKEQLKTLKLDKSIKKQFLVPIRQIILGMKLVRRDKRNIPVPYVKIEILIPHEIGTNIPQVLNSKWKLGLIGIIEKEGER